MNNQVRPLPKIILLAAAALTGAWILLLEGNPGFAQTVDPARAARIRDQIGPTGAHPDDKNDVNVLRSDLTKAMEAVVARLGALEKDMIDIKSRISVLEARKSVSDTKKTGAATHEPSQ